MSLHGNRNARYVRLAAGTEDREFNAANEITDIDTGITPAYDDDGNMTYGLRRGSTCSGRVFLRSRRAHS